MKTYNEKEVLKLLADFGTHVAEQCTGKKLEIVGELMKWWKLSIAKSMTKENFIEGDLVELKYDIPQNEDDGEYGYSINKGEIGEIRYVVLSTKNESDENIVYMIKFPDKDGKRRYMQLTKQSFFKVSR